MSSICSKVTKFGRIIYC